jgi:putative inorganic carbon (HCO3(-)) transporter
MRDLFFAGIWVVLFPVALWSAHIGVLLWIWVALISPSEQLYGFMQGVQFNKLVAVVTVIVLFLSKEKKKFYVDPILVSIFLLAIIVTLSAVFTLVETDDGWYLYQKILKIFALTFLITGLMWSRHRLQMTVNVLCISVGFTAVVEGLEYIVSAGGHKITGTGSMGDNNAIALAVLMIIPLLWFMMTYAALRYVRLVIVGVIVVSLFTIVGTFSRGGFVGLVVLGLFLVLNSRKKALSLALIAVVGIIVYLAAPTDWVERVDTIKDAGDSASFMGRVVAWKISTLIAMDSPLFGGGLHAVQRFPVWSHYLPSLPTLDFITTPEPDTIPHAAHSIYFEVLGDLGFGGLALFLSVLFCSLFYCHRIVRRVRGNPQLTWASDLARMLQITVIIFMVSGAALSNAYYEGFWIVIALVSRLNRTVNETLAGSGQAESAGFTTPQPQRTLEPVVARLS